MADVIHRLQGPDGKIHLISAPADADPAELEQYAATIFAPKKDEYDPTENMSELEKAWWVRARPSWISGVAWDSTRATRCRRRGPTRSACRPRPTSPSRAGSTRH